MSNRVVFMGTPDFAARHLEAVINSGFNVVGVFSQPDKASGRGGKLRPTPVKTVALNAGIPVFQPSSVNKGQGFDDLKSLNPDIVIVVAYGKILKQKILDIPEMGIYNVHASLLPRFRGAAPIQRAIECGDSVTGSCLMEIVEELDAGPVISRCEVKIDFNDTFDTVSTRLSTEGSKMLVSFLSRLETDGRQPSAPQPVSGITYARKICKDELVIDWNESNLRVHNKIRSLDSVPGAVAFLKKDGVKLFGSAGIRETHDNGAEPGCILEITGAGAWIKCGEGDVLVESVQFPGKRPVKFADARNGRKLDADDILKNVRE